MSWNFKKSIPIVGVLICQTLMSQNETLRLWEKEIPNFKSSNETEIREQGNILWYRKVSVPTLEVYLPTKQNATGTGVIICPGGGYQGLAYDWEGTDIAKAFNARGMAAFVLKYRMPQSQSVVTSHKAPLQDAQRAIRWVRAHAEQYNLQEDKIGIMGFSAGGHLAATLTTRYNHKAYDPKDQIDKQNTRPDFSILVYPVISMQSKTTHSGSKNSLLGNNPPQELVDFYSNELHVTPDTPPTLLIHSSDDVGVPVENSLLFYTALRKAGIYAAMHIYPYGEHGYALAINKGYLQNWPERVYEWIDSLDNRPQ